MTKVADVIAAIDAEGSSSWSIADAVAALDEIDERTGKPLALAQVAERIWAERGVEWTTSTLSKYRTASAAFPPGASVRTEHPFIVCVEMRAHPETLYNWKPTKPGDVLTQERARALRGGGSSTTKPKPDEWKQKVDKALGVIGNLAENDPVWTIDALEATIATIARQHPKAVGRVLRSVSA